VKAVLGGFDPEITDSSSGFNSNHFHNESMYKINDVT
jgi:hypothetical protein